MSQLANYNVKHTVDHFKNCCPQCGSELKLKKILKAKKGMAFYRRNLKSWICSDCGYAVYDSNEREQAITDGLLDNE
jgi:hypothetical protein